MLKIFGKKQKTSSELLVGAKAVFLSIVSDAREAVMAANQEQEVADQVLANKEQALKEAQENFKADEKAHEMAAAVRAGTVAEAEKLIEQASAWVEPTKEN